MRGRRRRGLGSLAPCPPPLFPQNLTPWHSPSGDKPPISLPGACSFPAQQGLHTGSLNSQITDLLFGFGVWVCVFFFLSFSVFFKAKDIYFQGGHQDFCFMYSQGGWGLGALGWWGCRAGGREKDEKEAREQGQYSPRPPPRSCPLSPPNGP